MSLIARENLVTGLVSITFRKQSVEQVIDLAKAAGLQAIEWGGDAHVPHGDLPKAANARRWCADAGLQIYAYGSYYRCGVKTGPTFDAVLDSVLALGAPSVRVWAGAVGSAAADETTRTAVRDDLIRICDRARPYNVHVDLEFHDGTLTDTAESAIAFIRGVDRPNLRSYWQPRHGFSIEQNLADLAMLGDRRANVHVFHWWPDPHVRWPLEDGMERWQAYLRAVASRPTVCALEFVRADDPAQLLADARTLRCIINSIPS